MAYWVKKDSGVLSRGLEDIIIAVGAGLGVHLYGNIYPSSALIISGIALAQGSIGRNVYSSQHRLGRLTDVPN